LKILFDNADFGSSSGPNSFARKLAEELIKRKHSVNESLKSDIQLSFIMASQDLGMPIIQRLDGIYFNSEQDWKSLNEPIKKTYDISSGVIFQSNFNKQLSEKYFGEKILSTVINNGTDLSLIEKITPLSHPAIDGFENVWSCASSWRPHKRLKDNVQYFLECAGEKDCLVIAGSNPDYEIKHERVFYVGNLEWEQLISLYKRSKYFIHLALMDHCPNVVVDARAAGCKIVCSSSGGTKEIAGINSVIVKDMEWDFVPFRLYQPPELDFGALCEPPQIEKSIDIKDVADSYLSFFEEFLK
jgi:glycosyltransferase involved in cell wall biosynthesis